MTKTFKTLSLSAVLAVGFLSAGAFANANTQNAAPANVTEITSKNITNIYKNSTWPLQGQITTEACKLSHCQEI